MTAFRLGALLFAAAAVASFHASAGEPADQPIVSGEVAARLDDYLSRLTSLGFCGVALVERDSTIILRKGYGSRDADNKRPFTTGTVSDVGSITKQFTAAAIMTLQARGKLRVEDSLSRFFENVPTEKQAITIHHLLTHTSGLPDAFGGDWDMQATRDRVLEEALQCELQSEPGEQYSYSNVGYSLLAMIVEKVANRPYEAFLAEELFQPAGLKRTGYIRPGFAESELAIGYEQGIRWGTTILRPMLPDGPCWNLRGNGGIHSTVDDMSAWVRGLWGDKIIPSETRDRMFVPGKQNYGYGWTISNTRRGTRVIQHSGGNDIVHADLKVFPEDKAAIVMLTNMAEWPAAHVTEHLAQILFDEPFPQPPKIAPVTVTPEALTTCAGRYKLPTGGLFEVKVSGGKLQIETIGQDAIELLMALESTPRERYRRLNAKTIECVEGVASGNFQPFREAMGPEAPARPLERAWNDMVAEHGPFRTVHILGTAPAWFISADNVATWFRVEFERGSHLARFHWNPQDLWSGLGGQAMPAPIQFDAYPLKPDEFSAFHLHIAVPELRLRFTGSPRQANSISFLGRGEAVTAQREQ